jgi:hypothetical protein
MVTNAGCAADLWIHPDVLKNLKEVAQGPVHITRMPYVVNKKKYNAIRIQTTTANGYMAYVYDLDTGMMIFNGSSTQGAVGVGGAMTQLTTGWLVEVKDVDVPWKAAAVPAWVGKFNELDYQGTQSTVALGGQLDRPMTITTTPTARRDGWLRTASTFTIQTFQGMPPDVSQNAGASGPASIGGQWIGPDAIPKLKARQVIYQDDITKTVTSVSDVNPRSVTISEVGQRHRIDCTYDAATGMLLGVQTTTTLGPARPPTGRNWCGRSDARRWRRHPRRWEAPAPSKRPPRDSPVACLICRASAPSTSVHPMVAPGLSPGSPAVMPAYPRAHHFRHICRYAASMLRAKRGASIRGDCCRRCRNVERSSFNRGKSLASASARSK